MMIRRVIQQILLVAIASAICWWLGMRIGRVRMICSVSIAMAFACVGAAAILRTTPIGKISWKNWVGGYLLPWGYSIGRGKLTWIVVISWAIWTLIALGVALVIRSPAAATSANSGQSGVWRILLLISWAIDAAAFLYVLSVMMRTFTRTSNGGKSLIKVMLFLVVLLAGSIALFLGDSIRLATLVAGGPIALVAILYGGFIGVVLLFGRNVRWN